MERIEPAHIMAVLKAVGRVAATVESNVPVTIPGAISLAANDDNFRERLVTEANRLLLDERRRNAARLAAPADGHSER